MPAFNHPDVPSYDQLAGQALKTLFETVVAVPGALLKAAYDGVTQSFTGGDKAFVCIPCKVRKLIYTDEYNSDDGRQFKVCGPPGGPQEIEVVKRMDDGSYQAIGKLPATKAFDENKINNAKIDSQGYPKTLKNSEMPRITHLNGINETPHSGLQGAMFLQQSVAQCTNKSPNNCVLYTYSKTNGMAADLKDCIAAKGYANNKVTAMQEQMMWDAINSGSRVTISAHSRGSIYTDTAWKNVHRSLSDQYYKEEYDSKEAREAERQAAFVAQVLPIGPVDAAPLNAVAMGMIARNRVARQKADERAAAVMNKRIYVIASGNAVSFPNSGQKGEFVYTRRNTILPGGDRVTMGFGSRSVLASRSSNMKNTEIDPDDPIEYKVAMERASQSVDKQLDTSNYHTFSHWYSGEVGRSYCKESGGTMKP